MTGFLLDTNVISELRKPRPVPTVVRFVEAQAEEDLFISDISFAEIRFGIEQLDDAERRASLTAWLDSTLRPLFEGRIFSITEDVILRWRLLVEAGRRRGHTFGQPDLFIAAIAAEENLVVVSRDTIHFEEAGVPVLNPWDSEFHPVGSAIQTISDVGQTGILGHLVALNRGRMPK